MANRLNGRRGRPQHDHTAGRWGGTGPGTRTAAAGGAACGIIALMIATVCGCRREQDAPEADSTRAGASGKHADLLIFPERLRVEDPAVNAFIETAMADCAAGNYDRFRLLWSAKEEPLSRGEFEQGWQAVREIRIRVLRSVLMAPPPEHSAEAQPAEAQPAYAVLADVAFDPEHRAGQREPNREVVLMMVHEQGAWRLAHAPKAMREWVQQFAGQIDGATALPAGPSTRPEPARPDP